MLAIIPARGGSRGIPGKNIKLLAGKPLIAYSIIEATRAKNISRIIVTTDSKEIAKVAIEYGAEIPFLRPKELAQDKSIMRDVLIHAANFMGAEEFIALLPTCPLRIASDIDGAIEIFKRKKADSVIAVTATECPVDWIRTIDKKGRLRALIKPKYAANDNRQAFKIMYRPNSMFVLRTALLKRSKSYYSRDTFPFIMPQERAIDIDSIVDFKIAEFLMDKREAV